MRSNEPSRRFHATLAAFAGLAASLAIPQVARAQSAGVTPPPVVVVEGQAPPPNVIVVMQPPAAPAPAPVPAAPVAADDVVGPPGDRPNEARFTDAHADHVILGLTAETQPKGTFYFSDYEIAFLQLGYAITDSLQVSLTGLPPIVKNQIYFFDLGLKLNVVRTDAFRGALVGAVDVVIDPSTSATTSTYVGGHVTGVGQFCFEKRCRSSLSLNAGAYLNNQTGSVLPFYGTAGLTVGVSKLVSLLLEPGIGGVVGTGQLAGQGGSFFFVDYGVRLSGKHFGVDLAFVKPVGTGTDALVVGFPWVGFTYRTGGSDRAPLPAALALRQ